MRVRGKCEKLLAIAALLACLCMTAQAAGVKADAVNELTPDAGVTVDGVTAQDGHVALPEVTAPADPAGKLYNDGGALHWNGVQLDQTSGVDAATLGDGSVSNAEFETLDGVSGPLQTQLDGKADDADLTAHTGDTDNPHGVTATQVGLGSVDNTADVDKPVSTVQQAALDGKLPYTGDAYIVVKTTSNAATNADNLRAAYTAAKALTPNGAALSATNRAVVLVPPGAYNLGDSPLTLNRDYVDLVGLSTARDNQHIYRFGHVLTQTASDVRIENLLLHYTGTYNASYVYNPNATWNDGEDHNGSPPDTVIRNCAFRVNNSGYRSMRIGVEYAGTYENCAGGGSYTFGGYGGTASGTFTGCTGGNYAFGGYDGTASGTFTNCTGGGHAFGGQGECTSTSVFRNCTGGYRAFGGYGTASGSFTNCTGGDRAFGGYFGTASGTFTGCTGGNDAFGGGGDGNASGTFNNCTGGIGAFGGSGGWASGGRFYHCVGGADSFTTNGPPTVLYCVRDGAAYP